MPHRVMCLGLQQRVEELEETGEEPESDDGTEMTFLHMLLVYIVAAHEKSVQNACPAAEKVPLQTILTMDAATADLKVSLGKMRRSGKAPPQPLTAHQTQVLLRLINAHGDDVEVLIF